MDYRFQVLEEELYVPQEQQKALLSVEYIKEIISRKMLMAYGFHGVLVLLLM
ncbi:MAG: hypothetical protein R2771_14325 [Saprospiraceae bacterium]